MRDWWIEPDTTTQHRFVTIANTQNSMKPELTYFDIENRGKVLAFGSASNSSRLGANASIFGRGSPIETAPRVVTDPDHQRYQWLHADIRTLVVDRQDFQRDLVFQGPDARYRRSHVGLVEDVPRPFSIYLHHHSACLYVMKKEFLTIEASRTCRNACERPRSERSFPCALGSCNI